MSVSNITSEKFNQMVQAASITLNNNAKFINSLNVFPVPDGDTGTNMSMSFASGAKYVDQDNSESVGDLAKSLAKGLLMGARGNSGVILSQIFRGFSKSVEDKKELDANDITDAFINSAKIAYGSVMKPTEGTILTVIKGIAQAGKNSNKKDLAELFDELTDGADIALKSTPDLLDVLKQVGVVDSGGQGLFFVIKAFSDVLNGRKIESSHQPNAAEMSQMIDANHEQSDESAQGKLNPEDIKYGYCTQIMVRIGRGKQIKYDFDYDKFYEYLAKLGDSLLVINDDEIVKVHVHTEHPGKVLAWGQLFGDLANVKVDNMRLQQEDIIEKDDKKSAKEDNTPKETAIISIVSGDGLGELFRSLGVTNIIKGGQTMNPSTQDIVDAVNSSNAKKAIVLPNNGNIFMAAEQAAEVSDIPTKIVHTKTLQQGLTSVLSFNPTASLDENVDSMEDMLDTVKSGEVTYAVRDTNINGVDIKKGHFMGIVDGDIQITGKHSVDTAVQMVQKMLDEDSEVITIIYGSDSNEKEANKVKSALEKIDSDLEIEVHEGDQPVYPFLVSVE
ncbi:DAK2 domain-containing protein [Apilactobacillus micheneri]|uniref:DAK2 domain-containing protein n=1 Tax=Apilactobacillus micheneri TaxID=1899430 RepID=A0A9Q8INR5_9LACO|nr:DAK2 domain-containing protein [Apilactobacillus micheneri]TPR40586.1 DAK2 domain-containing protein [Apilactobacillus micheneri]TPR42053.1 DAK2 domain-containing protein [Apilactobacillus micheneri]TPR44708.1 DAK2 domain-containing protein [Apilactobacillus micheneri]TPR45007.1 DAK2 domain-containing protein [Apilactobacillus micheneri]TPR46349.1 DAK2 domain-containing protein [Apilactobacillus micheneri]